MSFSHHSSEEQAARDRLLDEFLKKAPVHHPDGRLNRQDQGEAALAVAHDPSNQVVVIRFAKPMVWLAMNVQQAKQIRDMIDHHIGELEAGR